MTESEAQSLRQILHTAALAAFDSAVAKGVENCYEFASRAVLKEARKERSGLELIQTLGSYQICRDAVHARNKYLEREASRRPPELGRKISLEETRERIIKSAAVKARISDLYAQMQWKLPGVNVFLRDATRKDLERSADWCNEQASYLAGKLTFIRKNIAILDEFGADSIQEVLRDPRAAQAFRELQLPPEELR